MNNLNDIASQLKPNQLAELVAMVIDADIDSYNELITSLEGKTIQELAYQDRISELEQENSKLRDIALNTEKAISNLEERHIHVLNSAKKAVEAKDLEVAKVELQLKPFVELFGTIKQARERIKRLQTANEETRKRNERLTKENSQYKSELSSSGHKAMELIEEKIGSSIIDAMESVTWESEKGEFLILFHRQTSADSSNPRYALIYISETGSASLITLNEEGIAKLATQPKGGHKPSAELMGFATNWLIKVNHQAMIKVEDLAAFKNNTTQAA